MCRTAFYTDPTCKCRWMRVIQPCAPGLGFSTCAIFFNGMAKPQPLTFKATRCPCPVHDLLDNYDRNEFRMVVDIKNGMRWGWGPNKADPGVDFYCAVM